MLPESSKAAAAMISSTVSLSIRKYLLASACVTVTGPPR